MSRKSGHRFSAADMCQCKKKRSVSNGIRSGAKSRRGCRSPQPRRERLGRFLAGPQGAAALTSAALHEPFRATRRARNNPMHRYRSHTCGELRAADIGIEARLSGWVHRIRDHGGLLFIDLRDHYGLTQCVADPDSPVFREVEKLRAEWVVRLDGRVRARPQGTANPDLPTGEVELFVSALEVLGPAAELPLPVFGDQEYPEDIRLKYRFLDLRREHLHQNIIKRGKIVDSLRRRMKEQGFFEFQTPILTASSPEGARDYLVPSRLHPGKFYALPQAPQQFKQL